MNCDAPTPGCVGFPRKGVEASRKPVCLLLLSCLFCEEEMEAQRGEATCPQSHSWCRVELRPEPRSGWHERPCPAHHPLYLRVLAGPRALGCLRRTRARFHLYSACSPLLGRRSAPGCGSLGLNHCLSHLREHQSHPGPVKTQTAGRTQSVRPTGLGAIHAAAPGPH